MTKYYYHYPWRDVIITIHGEVLLLLSLARCYYYYPWRDVIITIHGEMLLLLSMARCYYYNPWRDVIITIHGEMLLLLSMARCYYYYPWRDVIITIHGRSVYSRKKITFQLFPSGMITHVLCSCTTVPFLIMAGIWGQFEIGNLYYL